MNKIVNDFSITVGTQNGSGSSTANNTILRAIFKMGIPVSGKNLFPSNIAGLPTWFTIRVNKNGWIARKKEIDFLIAMNADTAREDVMALEPGRVVVYEETLRLNQLRKDLTFFPVPFAKIATGAIAIVGVGKAFHDSFAEAEQSQKVGKLTAAVLKSTSRPRTN